MTMTTLFAKGYYEKAKYDTVRKFTQRCRRFGDRMSTVELKKLGVSGAEISAEVEQGLIKYDPNCGITKRLSGYSLTATGISITHEIMQQMRNQ